MLEDIYTMDKVILDFTKPTRVLYFITDKVNVLTN